MKRVCVVLAVLSSLGLATGSVASAAVPHTVEPGETLWSIAAASNFTTNALAAYNGLSPESQVVVGSTIQIPSESEAAAALGGATQAPAPQQTTEAAQPAAPAPTGTNPQPTNETTTASEIGAQASAHGTSPAVAAGVGYQESGFNNALTSSAGARGVMQIMPGTWDFIQQNLAGRPLNTASASENVHAGVMYLRYLQQTMGGDLTRAVAAYYQGPNSVKADGLLPETERYVQNVMSHSRRFGGP